MLQTQKGMRDRSDGHFHSLFFPLDLDIDLLVHLCLDLGIILAISARCSDLRGSVECVFQVVALLVVFNLVQLALLVGGSSGLGGPTLGSLRSAAFGLGSGSSAGSSVSSVGTLGDGVGISSISSSGRGNGNARVLSDLVDMRLQTDVALACGTGIDAPERGDVIEIDLKSNL